MDIPVPAATLTSFVVEPVAGRVYGYVPLKLARVHVTPVSQASPEGAAAVKSDGKRVCTPLVNGVAEREIFHPAPLPVLSPTSKVSFVGW